MRINGEIKAGRGWTAEDGRRKEGSWPQQTKVRLSCFQVGKGLLSALSENEICKVYSNPGSTIDFRWYLFFMGFV